MGKERAHIDMTKYEAAILDMDGVITDSARVHAASWKKMFDEYLKERSRREGLEFEPFDERKDYLRHVDGKPRYEGAKSFLESRGISLPYGSPDDPPGKETVCGLGNRKNHYFRKHLKEEGIDPYPTTVEFLRKLRERKIRTAVISSSRNAEAVLDAAGVRGLFDVVVTGADAAEHDLRGKPEPDIFEEAAKRLRVSPEKAVVVEDAIAGVKAGKAGGFAMVIGVDRSGRNAGLESLGADMVVRDLSEIGGV
jgi:alpha,alpha-trehalase